MGEDDDKQSKREEFAKKIQRKQVRRVRARREKDKDIWFGLGMFGLVGWSVTVPTMVGVAAGILIDTRTAGRFSWTLILLVAGLLLGCWNAWYWITKQRKSLERTIGDDE
jgi:ATP synthase protein I